MARREVVFTVKIQPGELVYGCWCGVCALPSAFDVPLYGLYPPGVLQLGELRLCLRCEDVLAAIRVAVERVAAELGGTVIDDE